MQHASTDNLNTEDWIVNNVQIGRLDASTSGDANKPQDNGEN